jgi:hypothetical protein
VQPTPALNGGLPIQPPPSLSQIAEETNTQEGSNVDQLPPSAPTPSFDIQMEVPTRRPTPLLNIPTSTPGADETTTTPTLQPTVTPMPPLGTPVVIFYAKDKTMKPGECTTVYWTVENVKAVYYENSGVDGRGEKEQCVDDDSSDYNLLVVMPNGVSEMYTVTVNVVAPTDTPAPTPTRTEEPIPTTTWTPEVPTATSTPSTQFGVRLEAADDTEIRCVRGSTCNLDLYAANLGNAIDNITILFTEASSWPRQLCRLDSVCSDSQMTLGVI